MGHPIICFGQQPCGFFPKRLLFAKISAARRLQKEIGGEIVIFFHESDHDPRETITILRDRTSKQEVALNFQFMFRRLWLHTSRRQNVQMSPTFVSRCTGAWDCSKV